jgi:two-component system sensor histidine kinase QseC
MDRLQAAFERERRFTANAAHELATPLAELRALADNALRWRNDLEATGRFAADAHEIALQMQRLVEALLGLARCESGRQPVVAERIALSEMLGEIRAGLAPRLAARQLAMTWDTPDGLVLESDRAMCHSIFSNLLDNAVEHTPVGGQIISRLESAPTGFVFTLANTNPGLTPADLPHLFEPLWRKDTARTDRLHSGLGLALAKALAERLGMQIKAGLAENGMFQVVWCLPHHPLGGG